MFAVLASAIATLTAQTTATPPVPSNPDETLVLSPFVVDASKDSGYLAENTLAGSRLNTALRDTAAPISVFTEAFLEDLAITNIEQLVNYSVGTQLDNQLNSPGTDANNHIGGANIIRRLDIRGIQASEALDYFRSITPNDSYRIDRYDESRGPNGILFGISSAGGLINQSSILARTNRDSGRISFQVGNQDTNRAEIRLNKVLMPKKLALAVAAVHQENGGWRHPDFQDKQRVYGTLTFSPTERITIRAMGERGNEYYARVAPYIITDNVLAWLDNRNALGVNAVTFTPTGGNPTTAQTALGVVLRNQAATGQRLVYIHNSGALYNSAGTFLTGSYNNSAVRAPDGTPGVNGGTLRPSDESLFVHDINSAGDGMFRDQDLENYAVTLDWQIMDQLNLNFAHGYQDTSLRNPHLSGGEPSLRGEANRTLGVNGPANPFVGQLYLEGQWRDADHSASMKESRISLSYDLKFERFKWLGSHRMAGMYSKNSEMDRFIGKRLVLLGAPLNPDPVNQANRITTRVYVDENNPRGFVVPSWRDVPSTLTLGASTYNVGWVNENVGTQNAMTTQDLDTRLIVLQSYFLDRRLVTVFGYREDSADIISFGHTKDPVTREDIIDPTKQTKDAFAGITRTQGVVYHLRDWLSLTANWSTNIGVPTFQNRLLPDGRIPSPTLGESEDFGFALDLFERRLSLRAVYYHTTEAGRTRSGGIDAEFNQRNIRVANALETALVGTGRPYTASTWAPIETSLTPAANASAFDQDSEGYELSLIANPTKNWRIMANYSYTDRVRTNTAARDALPYYGFTEADGLLVQGVTQNTNGTFSINSAAYVPGSAIARWIELGGQHPAANLTTLVTSANVTVAQEIFNLTDFLNIDRQEEEQRWGLRPHKVSMFTSYDFTEGRLKGFTVGGGYRWQSANIIGQDANGAEINGRILSNVDLMLRYRHPVGVWRVKGMMSYQINVTNLMDRDGIMPQRFSSTPDVNIPGGRGPAYSRFDFIDPRLIRFTTTFSF